MSTVIAEYKFTNLSDYRGAKERLSKELSYDSYQIYTYENLGAGEGFIRIYDKCSNPALAGQICRTFGGVPYSY